MVMSFPLIGVTGRAGAGKDSTCNMAVQLLAENTKYSGVRIALADPLKDACYSIFGVALGLPHHTFDGTQAEKNADIEAIPGWSGRKIAQHIGTEGFRFIYPDIWTDLVYARAKGYLNSGFTAVFVSDVRFINEAEYIQSKGGIIVRVSRPAADEGENQGIKGHASEAETGLIKADYVLDNSGTLDDLNDKVRNLLCQLHFLHST